MRYVWHCTENTPECQTLQTANRDTCRSLHTAEAIQMKMKSPDQHWGSIAWREERVSVPQRLDVGAFEMDWLKSSSGRKNRPADNSAAKWQTAIGAHLS
jgi:hypothetical protein